MYAYIENLTKTSPKKVLSIPEDILLLKDVMVPT